MSPAATNVAGWVTGCAVQRHLARRRSASLHPAGWPRRRAPATWRCGRLRARPAPPLGSPEISPGSSLMTRPHEGVEHTPVTRIDQELRVPLQPQREPVAARPPHPRSHRPARWRSPLACDPRWRTAWWWAEFTAIVSRPTIRCSSVPGTTPRHAPARLGGSAVRAPARSARRPGYAGSACPPTPPPALLRRRRCPAPACSAPARPCPRPARPAVRRSFIIDGELHGRGAVGAGALVEGAAVHAAARPRVSRVTRAPARGRAGAPPAGPPAPATAAA